MTKNQFSDLSINHISEFEFKGVSSKENIYLLLTNIFNKLNINNIQTELSLLDFLLYFNLIIVLFSYLIFLTSIITEII